MSDFVGCKNFSHDKPAATGVLLVNLGSPAAPEAGAVRRYLSEFLSDPRVIEFPRLPWLLILHGIILRVRPRAVARAYAKIWTDEGAPLIAMSRLQARALEAELRNRRGAPLAVALGMRYGEPSIAAALRQLQEANVRRLLVLPLYPQYSATTTASVFDAVADTLKTWRWLPELRMVSHYHDDPGYIDALAASIREAWEAQGPAEKLLFSFHGIPKRYFLAGDPYYCECLKTARLTAQRLELSEDRWQVAFQSRFGREEWLKPYTDATLRAWGKHGVKSVDVVCPGFAADCLETIEEIDEQNREVFLEAGGETYRYIPALNGRADHIRALADLVLRHAQGWPETDAVVELEATRSRALAMGAPE